MDDPWGSPWATSTVDPDPPPPHTTASSDPPPRDLPSSTVTTAASTAAAATVSSSPGIGLAATQSPWADDDDDTFGDWNDAPAATADPPATSQALFPPSSGWTDWADSNASDPTPQLDGTLDNKATAAVEPGSWLGDSALQPGPIRSDTSAFSSSLPLDPWASDAILEEPALQTANSDRPVDAPANPLVLPTKARESSDDAVPDTDAVQESVWKHGGPSSYEGDVAADKAVPSGEPQSSGREHQPDPGSTPLSLAAVHIPDPPRTSVGSRRSSTASVITSDRDRASPSPSTSVDEESKAGQRPSAAQRKASGKRVQELVVKFDTLAAQSAAVVEEPVLAARRSRDATPSGAREARSAAESCDDDGADFGDFEDAEDADAASSSGGRTSRASSPDTLATPQTPGLSASRLSRDGSPRRQRSSSSQDRPDNKTSTSVSPSPIHNTTSHSRLSSLDLRSVQFRIDLDRVDDLFPAAQLECPVLQPADATNPADVPDHIVTDSFSTISERKAWYRISRQGSSRKHNAGGGDDDDHYRRVAWPSSLVRRETLQIVRRWMEEDSITGRPTFGGGGRSARGKSNMFGWDSAAEPVALDQVFGRRRRDRETTPHSRAASLQQPMQAAHGAGKETAARVSVARGVEVPRPSSIAASPSAAVSFGWGDTAAAATKTSTLPPPPPSPFDQTKPTAGLAPAPAPAPAPVITLPTALLPAQEHSLAPIEVPPPSSSVLKNNDDDDDDEWGEMVSSPPADGKPDSFPAGALSSLDTCLPRVPPSPAPSPSVMPPSTKPPLGPVRPATQRDPTPVSPPLDLSFFDKPASSNTQSGATTSHRPAAPLPTPLAPKKTEDRPRQTKDTSSGGHDDIEAAAKRIVEGLPDFSYMLR